MDENDNIIVLIDDQGEEVNFEYLDTIEYEGSEYVVLAPVIENENEEDEEFRVEILRIEHGEEEDTFAAEENEEVLDAVFEIFKQKFDEELDDEEE